MALSRSEIGRADRGWIVYALAENAGIGYGKALDSGNQDAVFCHQDTICDQDRVTRDQDYRVSDQDCVHRGEAEGYPDGIDSEEHAGQGDWDYAGKIVDYDEDAGSGACRPHLGDGHEPDDLGFCVSDEASRCGEGPDGAEHQADQRVSCFGAVAPDGAAACVEPVRRCL